MFMVFVIVERRLNFVFEILNGGYVYIDYKMIICCGKGGMLLFENVMYFVYMEKRMCFCWFNVIVVKYICRFCFFGYYSF